MGNLNLVEKLKSKDEEINSLRAENEELTIKFRKKDAKKKNAKKHQAMPTIDFPNHKKLAEYILGDWLPNPLNYRNMSKGERSKFVDEILDAFSVKDKDPSRETLMRELNKMDALNYEADTSKYEAFLKRTKTYLKENPEYMK